MITAVERIFDLEAADDDQIIATVAVEILEIQERLVGRADRFSVPDRDGLPVTELAPAQVDAVAEGSAGEHLDHVGHPVAVDVAGLQVRVGEADADLRDTCDPRRGEGRPRVLDDLRRVTRRDEDVDLFVRVVVEEASVLELQPLKPCDIEGRSWRDPVIRVRILEQELPCRGVDEIRVTVAVDIECLYGGATELEVPGVPDRRLEHARIELVRERVPGGVVREPVDVELVRALAARVEHIRERVTVDVDERGEARVQIHSAWDVAHVHQVRAIITCGALTLDPERFLVGEAERDRVLDTGGRPAEPELFDVGEASEAASFDGGFVLE